MGIPSTSAFWVMVRPVLEPFMVQLIVLKEEEEILQHKLLHSSLLLLLLEPPHKIEMVIEYLMLMITVPIFLTQDVIKKEIQQ